MSLTFYKRSIAVVEDLNFNETISDPSDPTQQKIYRERMDEAYDIQAMNCAVAAAIYVVTLLISWHQYWLNTRATPHRYQRHY